MVESDAAAAATTPMERSALDVLPASDWVEVVNAATSSYSSGGKSNGRSRKGKSSSCFNAILSQLGLPTTQTTTMMMPTMMMPMTATTAITPTREKVSEKTQSSSTSIGSGSDRISTAETMSSSDRVGFGSLEYVSGSRCGVAVDLLTAMVEHRGTDCSPDVVAFRWEGVVIGVGGGGGVQAGG
jgi:hypothetical protein